MKYLLLGNGDIGEGALPQADCIVQFNLCRHLDRVPAGAAGQRFVFISNTGDPAEQTVAFLAANRAAPGLAGATLIEARNALYYMQKGALLRFSGSPLAASYPINTAASRLAGIWPQEMLTYQDSFMLDWRMIRAGMEPQKMPSTGMIAYDWAEQRLRPGDVLALCGFSWEGWHGHPWAVERRLMLRAR